MLSARTARGLSIALFVLLFLVFWYLIDVMGVNTYTVPRALGAFLLTFVLSLIIVYLAKRAATGPRRPRGPNP